MFLLHFAPDTVDVFWSTIDFGAHILLHRQTQSADKLIDIVFAVNTAFMQQFSNALIFCRVQVAETVIFQLPISAARSLSGSPVAHRCLYTLWQPVRARLSGASFTSRRCAIWLGKLDNHAAEVIHHCQQHAANVIDLF